MRDEKKRRVLFLRLIYAGIAVTLLSAAGIFFLSAFGSVLLVVAALSSVGTIVLASQLVGGLMRRIDSDDTATDNRSGYAEIRYDKKAETAVISGGLADMTGLELPGAVLDDIDYKKLVTDMIACPSDAGADIYMCAKPDSWIRIRTFETDDFEYTMVADVSELVSSKNIIKSLKYYDGDTGLLCQDAFMSRLRSADGTVGLITLLISGVDRLTSFKGTAAADRVISRAAAFLKKFENPHNVFAGRTATNGFCVLVTDTYDEGCRKYAEKLYGGLVEALYSSEGKEYIRVYCGYALFDGEEENDADTMMSSVEYAAYEAKSSSAAEPVRFDRANYVIRAYDFKKIQVFDRVVGENLVDYHFQPVVDAHTGAIFGYEALMRPREIDGIKLSPPEVLDIAEKQGASLSVENMTFRNTLRFLWSHMDAMDGKKLFINAIPNCCITEDTYEEFFRSYGGAFGSLVVEITEGVQITGKSLDLMRQRYCDKGAMLALDDYGSGYANESTLLNVKPDIIKIDRSLIMGIDKDIRKQHLVSNMIDFAKSHDIMTLGEGVETKGELETIIGFGIDLIQGYYTGKPAPELAGKIPDDLREELIGINLRNVGYAQKTFTIDEEGEYDLAEIAVRGCTDVVINAERVTLTESVSRPVSMRISCPDGRRGEITLRGVNVFGLDAPALTLGRDCDITLIAEDKNCFSFEGIRVPAGSALTITGDGQLNIDMTGSGGVIIGGSVLQDFGSIKLRLGGSLNITSQSDNMVGIGGGVGGEGSFVDIEGGLVTAELKGISVMGIGAVSGTVGIRLRDCTMDIVGAGQNVIAVGSRNGNADIACSAAATVSCSGDNCCGFGTLENGGGKMVFENGSYDITLHAKNSIGIGSMNGNADITVRDGAYTLFCEGNSAVGVGDCFGSGNVTVSGGLFRMHIASSNEVSIGSAKGRTVISGGNISTDSREKISAVSPYGTALTAVRRECAGVFEEKISDAGGEYLYKAVPSEGEDFVTVYLPV